jgi:inner membrane protein
MDALAAYLTGLGPWAWFILVVATFLLDTIVPGAHFLWFRIAAAGVGALALATGIAWQSQIMAFVVLSVAAALWVRRYVRPEIIASDVPELNTGGHQYVGRTLLVAEAIDCGRGRVRVGDTLWLAEGPDTAVGGSVRVTGARGAVLLVQPADGSPLGV